MLTPKMIWAVIVLGYCFALKDIIMWAISEISSFFRKSNYEQLEKRKVIKEIK